jgi:putative tryptophan/tyrosine transport system substrate-binding protein
MRRQFLGGALAVAMSLTAVGWSRDSWAQKKLARVGILGLVGADKQAQFYAPFYRTLRARGWVEGERVAFTYAFVASDALQLVSKAAELVRLQVDVVYADSAPAVRAAYAATRTIPIVGTDFTTDPIAEGYAQSYGRPGGNLTGVFLDAPDFSGKWLELLRAIVPGLSQVMVLWDPSPGEVHLRAIQGIARSFNVQLQVIELRVPADIDGVAAALRGRPQALIVLPSPMMVAQSARLANLAMKLQLPATSFARQFVEAGGLVSYGPDQAAAHERCGALVDRILRGSKPADLPIERPTKIKLIINLKAARALHLTIPDSVLARADEVMR